MRKKDEKRKVVWRELLTMEGESRGKVTPCVRITYAWIRGETRHSFCFGFKEADVFKPMIHIPKSFMGEFTKMMRDADVLSTVLRKHKEEANPVMAQYIWDEFIKNDPRQKQRDASVEMKRKSERATSSEPEHRKIREKRFATFADALKAKGQELPN